MTTNPLDEIQARADAATDGPWRLWCDPSDPENKRGASVETAWAHDDAGEDTDLITDWCAPTDAEFIAHAREDVPKLIAALRAVEAVCDAADGRDGPVFVGIMDTDEIRTAIREALG